MLRVGKNGLQIVDWYVDASFAVHDDFCLHTGGVLTLSEDGGSIISVLTKQQINTRSSTEAELVAVDDIVAKMVWVQNFMESQGYGKIKTRLHQDNQSAIILEEKGMASVGKRSRCLNIRYFFIKDLIGRGLIKVKYYPTTAMKADFMTKPLQGEQFKRFKTEILGQKRL